LASHETLCLALVRSALHYRMKNGFVAQNACQRSENTAFKRYHFDIMQFFDFTFVLYTMYIMLNNVDRIRAQKQARC
jgi:hypothetical protein